MSATNGQSGRPPVLVLVGAPGAGKTTVGRRVAERLDVAFRDTDADVEAAAGKAVSEIFLTDGEAEFRRMEAEAVRAALAEHTGVLALGGGAVLAPDTRRTLAGHRVIFLDVGLPDAARRVGLNRDRPLLIENPRRRLRELMEHRRPFYTEVATAVVATAGRTCDQVVEDVLTELERTR